MGVVRGGTGGLAEEFGDVSAAGVRAGCEPVQRRVGQVGTDGWGALVGARWAGG